MTPCPLSPAPWTLCSHSRCCLPEPPPSELFYHQEEELSSGLAFGNAGILDRGTTMGVLVGGTERDRQEGAIGLSLSCVVRPVSLGQASVPSRAWPLPTVVPSCCPSMTPASGPLHAQPEGRVASKETNSLLLI